MPTPSPLPARPTPLDVAWSADSRYVATASNDKTLRIWDASTGACLRLLKDGHTHWVSCCAFSAGGNLLVGAGQRALRSTALPSVQARMHAKPLAWGSRCFPATLTQNLCGWSAGQRRL